VRYRSGDMPHSPLATYLTDHLAAATAGVSLARRVARNGDGARSGQTLAQIAHEVADDRETLARLMSALGIRGSRAKNAATWLSERAARIKPNGRLRGDARMQRLHELEVLSLGIEGKRALWQALQVAPEASSSGFDLAALEARARDQREQVERERIAAARTALFPTPNDIARLERSGRSLPRDAR
jgi:hypothetical protein